MKIKRCPCHSQKPYSLCCEPFHKHKALPKTPLELMRSRYAAYALNLPSYIIETTHPKNPQYLQDKAHWKKEISKFSQATSFEGLEILDAEEEGSLGTVTFKAYLKQGTKETSFSEKSDFEKVDGKWFYRGGLLVT